MTNCHSPSSHFRDIPESNVLFLPWMYSSQVCQRVGFRSSTAISTGSPGRWPTTQTLPYFQNLSLLCRTMMPMWRMPSGIGSTPGTTAGAAQIIQNPTKSLHLQEALHGSCVFWNPAGIRLGEGIHQWWVLDHPTFSKNNQTNQRWCFSGNVPYFWTSGRLCDFDGCDRPDFFPKNINGWFWSANQVINEANVQQTMYETILLVFRKNHCQVKSNLKFDLTWQ